MEESSIPTNENMRVPANEPVIHQLVPWDDEILRTKMENFDFDDPPADPDQIAVDLIATMRTKKGVGLSANQIGLPYRVFAMASWPALVCFNPRVVDTSMERDEMEEACLSFPGLVYNQKRPKSIKVRFATPLGAVVTKTFTGMTARVFLHELEHLDGKFPFEGISRLRLSAAIKNAEKLGVASYTGKGLLKYAS